MTLIEPVSSLSIKRAVNLYTIIMFLSFGILLYWLATDRYQIFVDSHENTASTTTRIVSFEVNKTLKEKRRILDIFVESHKELITNLSNNPEDKEVYRQLETRLKKYLPDFYALNIMTPSGKPIINGFDHDVDERFLKDYLKNGEQNILLHPDHNVAHYDIISKYSISSTDQLFFVSFTVNEISDILSSTQPINHRLILVNKEANNLIEVRPHGNIKTAHDKLDYRMNGDDSLRVLSSTKVKGTNWHVIDMHKNGLFSGYRKKITTEHLIAFYIFSMIVLFMRNILIKQDKKRTEAEEQLMENHNQIKELNSQLELLSRTDSLTGLYNRRYFDEIIYQEWNRSLRSNNALTCILLDIDHFKDYNDLYGHLNGDKCIKDISCLMKDTFRRAGDSVARYGGEEFIIIMSDSSNEDAKAAITSFQKELKKLKIPHKTSTTNNYVTISAGFITYTPSQGDSIEDFIRKADKALYQAKAAGRNQWVMYGQ